MTRRGFLSLLDDAVRLGLDLDEALFGRFAFLGKLGQGGLTVCSGLGGDLLGLSPRARDVTGGRGLRLLNDAYGLGLDLFESRVGCFAFLRQLRQRGLTISG